MRPTLKIISLVSVFLTTSIAYSQSIPNPTRLEVCFIQKQDTLDMYRGLNSWEPVEVHWKDTTIRELEIVVGLEIVSIWQNRIKTQPGQLSTTIDLRPAVAERDKRIGTKKESEVDGRLVIIFHGANVKGSRGNFLFPFKLKSKNSWQEHLDFVLRVKHPNKTWSPVTVNIDNQRISKAQVLDSIRIETRSATQKSWKTREIRATLYYKGVLLHQSKYQPQEAMGFESLSFPGLEKKLPSAWNTGDITLNLSFYFVDAMSRKSLPEKPQLKLLVYQ